MQNVDVSCTMNVNFYAREKNSIRYSLSPSPSLRPCLPLSVFLSISPCLSPSVSRSAPPSLLIGVPLQECTAEMLKTSPSHPGDNPGANRWFLKSTPIQMLPPGGSICGRWTWDLPLGCLQGGEMEYATVSCSWLRAQAAVSYR